MLFKWKLEPYAIKNNDTEGRTIIEFLEQEIKRSSVGIVLLTGDDIGYFKEDTEDKRRPRARQNVILELGMLLGAIGRKKTIILLKTGIERPLDADGLIYLPFDKNVEEIKSKLKEKLENLGLIK